MDLGRGRRRCPFRPRDDLQLPNIASILPKKKRNKVETFIRNLALNFEVLALLFVRVDVRSCVLFMDVLRKLLRFYAYQLVTPFLVHHLLNKILDPPLKSTAHKLNKDGIMAMRLSNLWIKFSES